MSSFQSSLPQGISTTTATTTTTCCGGCCDYIKRTWRDETKDSCWSKVSFMLFYTFLWFQIVWCIPTLLFTRTDTGFECYFENFKGPYAHKMTTTLTKQNALLNIGVLLYANFNGIRIWNIGMIVILYAGYTYYLNDVMNLKGHQEYLLSLHDGPTMCDVKFATTSWNTMIYLFVTWPFLAMVCSIIDASCYLSSSTTSSSPGSNIITFLHQVNPIRFLKYTWQRGTNSTYGKVSMILFYVFLWLNILWGIQNIFVGDSNGDAGFECYYENLGPYAVLVSSTFSKQNFLFIVGFLLYAHSYGIRVWNVLFVVVQFVGYIYFMWKDVLYYNNNTDDSVMVDGPTCDEEFVITARYMFIGMFLVWPILTFMLAIVDANKGTREEDGGGLPIIANGSGRGGGATEPDESTSLLNTWEV